MRIAIVGSGVSGLVAARELARDHDVDVFEAADRPGGHVHTHTLDVDGTSVNVDTGFIVFNDKTYPGFCSLLRDLGVESQASDMGLSVRCERKGIEYNGRDLGTIFAQRSNLFRPSFHRMLLEIIRFHREARELLEPGASEVPIREWLDEHRYTRGFRELYLEPMAAAIWSAPLDDVQSFPARFLARFLSNHGMLQVDGRPQWRTVRGGSKAYVDRLLATYRGRLHLSTPVASVVRSDSGVELILGTGERRSFDRVVLATHTDTSLKLLAAPTREERAILGAIRYQTNEAILHTDSALMPVRPKCWASWNCLVPGQRTPGASVPVAVTYWMNRLQSLDVPTNLFVTLNASERIDPARVLRRMTYHHPQFGVDSPGAQASLWRIQGIKNTWFCGAWAGFGFHEDGLVCAMTVVRSLRAGVRSVEAVA